MRITSRENRQIKEIAKLYKNGRSRKENGLFVVEGARICADAAESGIEIVTLVCSDTGAARYPDAVKALSDAAGRRISVPDAVFAALADTAHPQGILAVCRMPELSLRPEDIRPDGRYLGLEDLRDPANLGTIARTAEAPVARLLRPLWVKGAARRNGQPPAHSSAANGGFSGLAGRVSQSGSAGFCRGARSQRGGCAAGGTAPGRRRPDRE